MKFIRRRIRGLLTSNDSSAHFRATVSYEYGMWIIEPRGYLPARIRKDAAGDFTFTPDNELCNPLGVKPCRVVLFA